MATDTPSRVQFGDFEADLIAGELFRGKAKVPIQDKPFQLLTVLLGSEGQLVSRNRLYRELWPDVTVEVNRSLNTAVRNLRRALGDVQHPANIIQTVRNRGYRLLVPAEVDAKLNGGNGTPALVVVPFESLNGVEQEFFADGFTEQMIAQLGRHCRNLRVIAPVSANQYRNSRKGPLQIGKEVRADYILGGSILRDSGRVRITARLIRVEDQSCAWSDSYGREAADIFFIQDTLTQQIARAILHVFPDKRAPNSHLTTTPAVYEKYLKGCCFAAKWIEPEMEKAVQCFEEVIAEDPGFAPAYGSLAMTYTGMIQFGILPPTDAYELAKSAASKGLALCDELSQAHHALGGSQLFYEADFDAAEKSFLNAIEVNPSCADGHMGYSQVQIVRHEFNKAVPPMAQALRLDPLSPMIATVAAANYYYAGRYADALRCCEDCLEMHPEFAIAHGVMGSVYQAMGDMDAALRSYRNAVACYPDSGLILAQLAQALAVAGHTRQARKLLRRVLSARQRGCVPSYWIALVYVGLGDIPAALEWLRMAFRERCGWRITSTVDPKLRPLANHSEFEELLKQLAPSGAPKQN